MSENYVKKQVYFAQVPYWVHEVCSIQAVSAYIALSKFADNNTKKCYPSYRRLAETMGASERTAIRAVKELEDKGAILIERRPKEDGDNETNIYELIAVKINNSVPTDTDVIGGGDTDDTRGTDTDDTRTGDTGVTQTISSRTISNTTISKKNQDFSPYNKYQQTQYVNMLLKTFNIQKPTKNKWGQLYNCAKQLYEAGITVDEIPTLVRNVALTYGEKYTTVNSILNHTELLNGVKDKSADEIKEMLGNKELLEWANDN